MIIDTHNSIIPWDEKACELIYPPKVLESFRLCSYENIISQLERRKVHLLIRGFKSMMRSEVSGWEYLKAMIVPMISKIDKSKK